MPWSFNWERAVKSKGRSNRPPYREAVAEVIRNLFVLDLTPRTRLSAAIARKIKSGEVALELAKVNAETEEPFSAMYIPLSQYPELVLSAIEGYLSLRGEEVAGVGEFPAVPALDSMLTRLSPTAAAKRRRGK